jgi:thiamine-monophosphate kinase
MNLKELGGEFKLIERLTRQEQRKEVIVGIGDDAAVVQFGNDRLVVTADMICDGDHFSRRYFTPRQIGIKAMESNLSDIAAMGGIPLYALVTLSITRDTDVETMDGIYEGLYERAQQYDVDIIGGDTTHSSVMIISVTLLGRVEADRLVTRAGARPGDIIKVTGPLGASTAGLNLFLKNIPGFDEVKRRHTEPRCRLDISDQIAQYATAMEDVSDGLASEVRNICQRSGVGAVIEREAVPVEPATVAAAQSVGGDAVDYALFGGEDFELAFCVSRRNADKTPGKVVGEIMEGEGVYLRESGVQKKLERFGWDHFQ